MINEKATWSSFSGALAKIAKDRAPIPSERGKRYFGPSKMSFKNLLIHSLAIISVFKINVLIRSILFLIVYKFLIHHNISVIYLRRGYESNDSVEKSLFLEKAEKEAKTSYDMYPMDAYKKTWDEIIKAK